jgi:hypothetical protein
MWKNENCNTRTPACKKEYAGKYPLLVFLGLDCGLASGKGTGNEGLLS